MLLILRKDPLMLHAALSRAMHQPLRQTYISIGSAMDHRGSKRAELELEQANVTDRH